MTRGDAGDDVDNAQTSELREESEAADPDSDIVALIQQGEIREAMRLLMARHGKSVWVYCSKLLKDRTLADDVHQMIFIQAHRDLTRFAGFSSLRSWLLGIARHRILDARKGRKIDIRIAEALDVHAPELEIADTHPSPEAELEDARLLQSLRECLDRLPALTQEVILLRYQQALSFDEMAAIYSQKPSTLRHRTARALIALRRCMESRTGSSLIGRDVEIDSALRSPTSSPKR